MAPLKKGDLSQEEKELLEAIGKEVLWELLERENEGRQGQRRKRGEEEEEEKKEESSQVEKLVPKRHQEEEEPSSLVPGASGSPMSTLEEEVRRLQSQNKQLTAKVAALEKWAEGYMEQFIPLQVQVSALERRAIEDHHRIRALEEDLSSCRNF